jgi:hypothetical protein
MLVNALAAKHLVLREDSKLCQMYIEGCKDAWTLEQIVHRMCQMKYLYDYCHMDECCDEAYKEQKEEKQAGYWPDRTVMEQAEMIALEKYGNYPLAWPWLL